MKKKQNRKQQKDDSVVTLKDSLGSDLLAKLKETKKELEEKEQIEKQKKKSLLEEEKKRKEKNKSFEELLNESSLDWKKFK